MTDSAPLPKQEFLLKLLRMTTSDNDAESLVALRKANAFMASVGWDWEKLINAKIKIVADPFANLSQPTATRTTAPPTNGAYASAPYPPRAPSPPPPQRMRGTPMSPISTAINRYVAHCWCCGIEVVTGAGFIFKPTPTAPKYECVCATCNTSATVYTHPAQRVRPAKGKKSISDLA